MTGRRRPSVPFALEALARGIIRDRAWRESTLGDLAEEYAGLAGRRGRAVASLWYLAQIAGLAAHAAGRMALGALRALSAGGDRPWARLAQEARLAVRALRRQPVASGAVVLTLALGLGANASAFSMLRVLLLRPFAFDHVDRLAVVSEYSVQFPFPEESVSLANFTDWQRQATRFDRLAAFEWGEANVSDGTAPERLLGFHVTGEFFGLFGVRPAQGRLLGPTDDPGTAHEIVIGDALWRGHFGADPLVVGRTLRIDGEPYTVVGVAPAGFTFPEESQFWTPLPRTSAALAHRADRRLTVIGHLRDGDSLDSAAAEMNVIGARLTAQYPAENTGFTPRVQSFARGMGDAGVPAILSLIQSAALMVLLIGGTNIASLLLVQGWDRRREIAVRLALGASRARVIRQLIVESLVLGVVSVPIALAAAAFVLRGLKASLPARVVRFVAGWEQLGVDGHVIWFTLAASVVSAMLLGLFPALQTSRPALVPSLRDGGRSMTSGGRFLVRRAFVILELALVLPLLVASGLAAVGALRFATGPQGYDPSGIELMQIALPEKPYASPTARRQFAERLTTEAGAIPGVATAATINVAPTTVGSPARQIEIDGHPPVDLHHRAEVSYRVASSDYFQTMRIPILSGRAFSGEDTADGAPVAVVTRSLAAKSWPDGHAVGRRIRTFETDGTASAWMTVVGVAGDVIDDWYDRRETPMLYVPSAQRPSYSVTLVVRTTGDPDALAPAFRRTLHAVDPDQSERLVLSLRQSLADRTSALRQIASIMAGMGVVALVLAAIGIYSLMSCYVSQRRYEIGVRMALGATRRDVARQTLGQTARLSSIGLAIGVMLAIAASSVIQNLLFGIVALRPVFLVGLTLLLALVSVLATLGPLRQAMKIGPSTALRME